MNAFRELAARTVSIEWLYSLGARGLRIVLVLVAALVVSAVLSRALPRFVRSLGRRMQTRTTESEAELAKRSATLSAIAVSVAKVAIWIVALLMALREIGFDIAPVLAGAGVVGLAVGFGAQNLVRDVITGAFMLLENQVRVGDVAIVNGTGGLVERMTLRTITLRGQDGTVHVFPNGSITTLSNMTHEFSFYVFDIGVAYKEDTDHVVSVLEEIGREIRADEKLGGDTLEPLEVLGVDAFQDSAVIVKARIKTKPIRQWAVGREMNRRIKKRFDELGIEIPFPHRTVYLAEGSAPLALASSPDPKAPGASARGRNGHAEA